jgi:hypothetical protein
MGLREAVGLLLLNRKVSPGKGMVFLLWILCKWKVKKAVPFLHLLEQFV